MRGTDPDTSPDRRPERVASKGNQMQYVVFSREEEEAGAVNTADVPSALGDVIEQFLGASLKGHYTIFATLIEPLHARRLALRMEAALQRTHDTYTRINVTADVTSCTGSELVSQAVLGPAGILGRLVFVPHRCGPFR